MESVDTSVNASMFSLKSEYNLEKPIHKIDFMKYSPSSLATIKNTNSNISISLPREDAYICLQLCYISLDFEVLKETNTRYADGDQISIVNFGPFVIFKEAKVTTSSGKHLEKVDNLHPISLLYKCLSSTQSTSQLLYGFEESVTIRRQELTNNKTEKGNFFVRIKLKDLFGFVKVKNLLFGFGQLKSESNLLNPFLALHKFRSSYKFYVFDLSLLYVYFNNWCCFYFHFTYNVLVNSIVQLMRCVQFTEIKIIFETFQVF